MNRFYYLVHLQFLGFRYHGWQKQIDVKTVQYMLERTLITILKTDDFKTLGASRTDSMVSANHHLCQLALPFEIDPAQLCEDLNHNLPQDIKALKVEEIEKSFNLMGSNKIKEYHYYFSYGEKAHPFSAPFMTNVLSDLDIKLMQKGAKLFEGTNNFIQYCFRGNENKVYQREVLESTIEKNTIITASFFPDHTFLYRVKGAGFMRNQIRLMMGTLFTLGQGKISMDQIQNSLKSENTQTHPLGYIAPASGLVLYKTEFNE